MDCNRFLYSCFLDIIGTSCVTEMLFDELPLNQEFDTFMF
jgi:hypothetical protein